MQDFRIGDVVARKSYGGDIFFKISDITNKDGTGIVMILQGLNHRLIADAPPGDLMKATDEEIDTSKMEYSKVIDRNIRHILMNRKQGTSGSVRSFRSDESFGKSGRVLHIDADEEYLNTCLKTYKQLNIEVVAKLVDEPDQPVQILGLLKEVRPDILVLTGHDAILKGQENYASIDSYRSSKYFIEAVKMARTYEPSLDDLVIFAGACQSFYEAIIKAGANYASSPHRVLIHALDPVFVCEKVAYTSINKVLPIQEAVSSTITGIKGVGGLETRGKYREGFPKSPYL
jgi:sporulation peptidase YabG